MTSFVRPVLENHDRSAVEVFAYSDASKPDAVTRHIEKTVDKWRDTSKLDDTAFAAAVRADRIDVLVELTGHIGRGRLVALARRPAPVQVSYIGYQGTTGSRAIDYVLTDSHADPAGAEAFYVEKPFRMDVPFFCYELPAEAPLVAPLPAMAGRGITFGCLNAVHKVTPTAVRLWARVMREVVGSSMIVLVGGSRETAGRIRRQFVTAGITPDRLTLLPRTNVREYFRLYNRIDIALDPVPFVGHTTTLDAAWMGVPTVTLTGPLYAHRYGGSVLLGLGLDHLVAETKDQYAAAAVGLAGDVDKLKALRSTLRGRLQRSPLTDAVGFTRRLESAYRRMWTEWAADAGRT